MNKPIKRLCLVLFVMSALLFASCTSAQEATVTREFDLPPFSAITAGGAVDIIFRQSDVYRAVVTGNENLFERLELEVDISNNSLHVDFTGDETLELVVYAPMLQEVRLSGAASAHIDVDVQDLYVRLSGASFLVLSGQAHTFEAHASGASDIHAFNLITTHADLHITGASEANVYVVYSLYVVASGNSHVVFMGSPPVVTSHTSGASSITQY